MFFALFLWSILLIASYLFFVVHEYIIFPFSLYLSIHLSPLLSFADSEKTCIPPTHSPSHPFLAQVSHLKFSLPHALFILSFHASPRNPSPSPTPSFSPSLSVSLSLCTVPPTEVSAWATPNSVESGQVATLTCQSSSSVPPSTLVWHSSGSPLVETTHSQSQGLYGGTVSM